MPADLANLSGTSFWKSWEAVSIPERYIVFVVIKALLDNNLLTAARHGGRAAFNRRGGSGGGCSGVLLCEFLCHRRRRRHRLFAELLLAREVNAETILNEWLWFI